MSDGNFQNLPGVSSGRERRVCGFNAQVDLTAKEAQLAVAKHCARKEAGFKQDLKAVADAYNEATLICKALDGAHDGRESSDCPCAQIISKSESARNNDCIAISQIAGIVPQEFDGLVQDGPYGVIGIVIAVRSRKDDNAKFHFCEFSTIILAHAAVEV